MIKPKYVTNNINIVNTAIIGLDLLAIFYVSFLLFSSHVYISIYIYIYIYSTFLGHFQNQLSSYIYNTSIGEEYRNIVQNVRPSQSVRRQSVLALLIVSYLKSSIIC